MKSATRKNNILTSLTDMEAGLTLGQAIAEADRCLLCHDAPCSAACPAGTDPGRFIRKLKFKNIKGAIRTIRENNSLGGVCGIVCPTDKLCEGACSATEIDRTIEIGRLQRALVEHGWDIHFNPVEKQAANGIKVAIVGSGPAGLSCAAELAKAGFSPVIFEARAKPGGMLRYGVPEFRLNSEFFDRELDDIRKLGVEIKCNSPVKPKGVENLLRQAFKAVFIAVGIWESSKLKVPGSDLKNIITAMDFLESARSGNLKRIIKLVKNKNIGIMGGGDVAMDVACTCKALGANKVYIIYRRSLREMPADAAERAMALDNHVIFRTQSTILEFTGKKGILTGLKGIETDWKKKGDFSAANLKAVAGTEFNLVIDAFVFAIGLGAKPEVKSICAKIRYDKNGCIKPGTDGVSTSDQRIFAGGDIVRGEGFVVQAVQDGKVAAQKIIKLLGGG